MDISYLAVITVLGMIGLAFVALIVLSARNLFNGKHSIFTMLSFLVPVVVFAVSFVLFPSELNKAAVLAAIIMFVLGLLSIVLSGVKSIFT